MQPASETKGWLFEENMLGTLNFDLISKFFLLFAALIVLRIRNAPAHFTSGIAIFSFFFSSKTHFKADEDELFCHKF